MSDAFFEDDAIGKVYDRRLFVRLLRYLRPYRLAAAAAVTLIILSSTIQLVTPLLTAAAIDLYVRPPEAETTFNRLLGGAIGRIGLEPTPREGVLLMAILYVGVLLCGFVVRYAQSFVMQMMGQRIMFDIRRDIFDRLQALPIRYFDRNPVGRLVTRATTDVGALNELFTAGFVTIFGDLAMLVGIMTVLFAVSWKLALVSFAILPFLLLLSAWFKRRVRTSYRAVRKRIARINAYLQEHIGGMAVVQLFGVEKRVDDRFGEINEDHRVANVDAIRYYAIYYPAIELITAFGLALVIWYGGGSVLAGTLTFGFLVAYLQYVQRFYQPLADLSDKVNILQSAMAAGERIFGLLDQNVAIASPEHAHRPERIDGAIAFRDVRFAYVEDEPVLHDLSLEIAAGETVAVVGHTGAGKSTLANLLLRFYDVDGGSVTVDGVDIREWDLGLLRRAVAIVLQDVFLFSGTLASNIRLGEEGITDERIAWATREVGIAPLIEQLPDGLDTEVRERGSGLSVGQKQLVAFARALAADPRILILDEATASVDTETEQQIQHALDRLLVDRTSLVIAHRLSTIQKADRIVVLHKGRLAEQGTHHELIERDGIYRKLYELQWNRERLAKAG